MKRIVIFSILVLGIGLVGLAGALSVGQMAEKPNVSTALSQQGAEHVETIQELVQAPEAKKLAKTTAYIQEKTEEFAAEVADAPEACQSGEQQGLKFKNNCVTPSTTFLSLRPAEFAWLTFLEGHTGLERIEVRFLKAEDLDILASFPNLQALVLNN